MTRTHRTTLAATLLLATLSVAGCSSSSDSANGTDTGTSSVSASSTPTTPASSPAASSSAASPSSKTVMLTIKSYKFSAVGTVAPGTQIMVMNEDSEAHTVTADDGRGGFDVTVAPGKSAMFAAPSSPGSYSFHCTYHSNMHGTLTVG